MTSVACELWLTIGNERCRQISAGPQLSSLGRIPRCDHDIGIQYVAHINLLIPELGQYSQLFVQSLYSIKQFYNFRI